ncbi:MAG: hypothetical protein CVV41_10625 [Candidatus Riflebacteria bacterium HGW-Riflebacteria-1]|nr:MAG: hypothetical protein CVV41_10625 [Candidatus Riflebacteria bacterium HGW-Riflebacteria-1]
MLIHKDVTSYLVWTILRHTNFKIIPALWHSYPQIKGLSQIIQEFFCSYPKSICAICENLWKNAWKIKMESL